jgi:hypothetical protein
MRILCTFPGRYGDLLWALPTVRAIAEATGARVRLQIAGEFASLTPLLEAQPYLDQVVADPSWDVGTGWRPLTVAAGPHDRVFHLGYRRWPELPLPVEIDQTVRGAIELPPLDLTRPWITALASHPRDLVYGFTDCHFELKYGLTELLFPDEDPRSFGAVFPPGSRWLTEGGIEVPASWTSAAQIISGGRVFFGDCSALHVLAVALGKPVVLVEPMEARWNPIFYPLGMNGPQVTVVKGLDGRPTFDARHCAETLQRILAAHL